MQRFKIIARYIITKELEVEVPDGSNPMSPSNWSEIENENELDFNLYEVDSATELEDTGGNLRQEEL
jgi:hypothetical protein